MTALSTGETYSYDANGNVTQRVEGGLTYTQTFRQALSGSQCDAFDAKNRLISVTVSGQATTFIYDGDGSKSLYVDGIYEVDKTSGGSVTRTVTYYPVAGAMRINSTLYYILKDHLGSASVITDASGNIVGENRYYPFGETRLSTGSIFTDKLYTGQREMAGLGIYHYQARFYSPKLGRFLSPDTIIPEFANPQSWNRYSYVYNNPIRYNDPTGHCPVCAVPIVAADVALMVGVTLFVTALLLPPVHDALVDNITNGIEALQVKTKKPLTKDEEKKIKHLGEDSENFLREHPDLKKEAQKKAKGEENEYDHVGEAEDWVRGLENDKRHLQRVRDLRNKEAQQAIDRAIEKGQKWINQIIRKLYGKE